MDTLTTEAGKPAPFRASITCDPSQTSGPSALTSEIMKDLTILNDLPFAPIFEIDDRKQIKIGLVFESAGQRDNCLALLKQTHATLATKGILVPTGCATTSSGATRSDDLIKRSELALIHGKKITENGWFLHDTMHLANWDNNEYEALLRALHDGCIEPAPCELRAADQSLQNIVELHALWPDSPYPSHRTSNGLKDALEHYHLLKNTSITDMEAWHRKAAQYLESHQEHLVSISIPDELVKNQTILAQALSIHQSSSICANLIIRISHHAATEFNEASWCILEKLRDTGAKFALGDIGSGNTDIQLLKHPIFSFLHFGSQISAQSLENERSKIIFTELLDLAARLGKPSIVKSTPEYARDLFKLGASYADVD
jgi:EAL domain-containing protein (putative c-di-GMP-specific phosphodiesterase class I)